MDGVSKVLTLSQKQRSAVMSGSLCPSPRVHIRIKLVSDIFGDGYSEVGIPFLGTEKEQSSHRTSFQGGQNKFVAPKEKKQVKKLNIEKINLAMDGEMTIRFNKPI